MEGSASEATRTERFWVNAFFLGFLVLLVAFFALAARKHSRDRSHLTRCANNLRAIGLAAIQYADDKHFFPEIQGVPRDAGTSYVPRVMRSLFYFDYLEDPEAFVCPGESTLTTDHVEPMSDAARKDPRRWGWGGADEPAGAPSPIASAGASDQPLGQLHDLSYGWTKKHVPNVSGTNALAADRTILREDGKGPHGIIGNHGGTVNILALDAHVQRRQIAAPESEKLVNSDLAVFWDADGASR